MVEPQSASTGHTRWTKEEELKFIQGVASGQSLDELGIAHSRTKSALQMRLKKIIYENVAGGKSANMLATMLKLPVDKVKQYFYSYKEFIEKNKGIVPDVEIKDGGAAVSTNKRIDVKKLEDENRLMKLILEHNKLSKQINRMIKDGKLDGSVISPRVKTRGF